MNTGRDRAVFVNKTGGGVTIDNITVPSGFDISSVTSPTGSTLHGSTKYKGVWVNHEEKITIYFKTAFNGFNTRKSGNTTIYYTCEDNTSSSHSIALDGTVTIDGNFPSKIMCTIAFFEQRPRGHVLNKDTTNRVHGYPTYVDKTGKVYMYARYRGAHLYWTFRYDGTDRVYHNSLLRSTGSNSGISADEALRSFPADCSYYGNTHHRWGFDSKYNMSASSTWFSNANDCSYMKWNHIDSAQRDRVRLFFFQNVDAVGWSSTGSSFSESSTPEIKHVQLRTDKSSNNRWIQIRTDDRGDKYNLREWMFHKSNGSAARVITQYANFDVDTLKLGFGDPGVGFVSGYCKYRRLQVRREASIAIESHNPSSNDGRMSHISKAVSLPEYHFTIHKNSPNSGSDNGWSAGRLTATSSIYQDCGYDTKYTITRTSAGTINKLWYNEGANPSSNSNWQKTNGGKGTGLYTFDAPQGNGIKAHGKSSSHTPLIFNKTGIPAGKWRVKVYVMCVASWDREDGSVTINGKKQLTFRSHGYHMYETKAHNGASFSYKAGQYRNTPTRYKNSTDWTASSGPRSVFLVSDWFTGSECTAQFNFNTNQSAEDESGFVSHMQIETQTTDSGNTQPLIDINRYVVMGVNQNKTGILTTKKYSWFLKRGHNSGSSRSGSFDIVTNSRTSNASVYIRDKGANWGGVGVNNSTYHTGWQCCESGKGLGSYCNLYSPEDAIRDANSCGGLKSNCSSSKKRSTYELFVCRGLDGRTPWSGATPMHTQSTPGGVGDQWLQAASSWGYPFSMSCCAQSRNARHYPGLYEGKWKANQINKWHRGSIKTRGGKWPRHYNGDANNHYIFKDHVWVVYDNPTDDVLRIKITFNVIGNTNDCLIFRPAFYNMTKGKWDVSPESSASNFKNWSNLPHAWGTKTSGSISHSGQYKNEGKFSRGTYTDTWDSSYEVTNSYISWCRSSSYSRTRPTQSASFTMYSGIPPRTKYKIHATCGLAGGSNEPEGGGVNNIVVQPWEFV